MQSICMYVCIVGSHAVTSVILACIHSVSFPDHFLLPPKIKLIWEKDQVFTSFIVICKILTAVKSSFIEVYDKMYHFLKIRVHKFAFTLEHKILSHKIYACTLCSSIAMFVLNIHDLVFITISMRAAFMIPISLKILKL